MDRFGLKNSYPQDSVQGSILKEKNITLDQFQSMLKNFKKTNKGVNFHLSISESEYQNLLQQQNKKIDRGGSNSCVSGKNHPFYGDYKFNENHQTNFLEGFV